MSNPLQVDRLLLALTLLLACAHIFGGLFRRWRQPPVIGEIAAGLMLGPTVLGSLAPPLHEALFSPGAPVAGILAALFQLGLVFLMFHTGMEIRWAPGPGERRSVAGITAFGLVVPFATGALLVPYLDLAPHLGEAANPTAFLLVFAIALSVTSIPVISRILLDLGLLDSRFGRVVLSAAVLEDVLLYAGLAVALALVAPPGASTLIGLLPFTGSLGESLAAHLGVTAGFVLFGLVFLPRLCRTVDRYSHGVSRMLDPAALLLVFLLAVTAFAAFVGVSPMLGAFVAGMAARRMSGRFTGSYETLRGFAFTFFIPVYFVLVGLRLDFGHAFAPLFFLQFFVLACAAKVAGVYVGARWAGEPGHDALHLSVAMNARGGPGIVLASVAFDAGIVSEGFYASLVLLAVLSSALAGAWLTRWVGAGRLTVPGGGAMHLPPAQSAGSASIDGTGAPPMIPGQALT